MAPRKKKPSKAAARKKSTQKKIEIVQEANSVELPTAEPEPDPEPEPPEQEPPVAIRQHKKFGKFRCLLEEPKPDSDDSNMQEATKTDAEEAEKVDDSPVALLQPLVQMEYVQVQNEEVELTEQLTHLNVVEDYSTIIGEGNEEIYIDNVESDITVECVSEEVFVEPEEQIIEEADEEPDDKTPEDAEDDEEKLAESEETTEKQKKPKKKPAKPRKTLSKGVTTKVKAVKTQLILEAQNSNSDASSASESSIRRSNRIKSITVLKQKTKGHGLVKKTLDSDTSENSNSSHVDSEKIALAADPQAPSPHLVENDATKPVKVKSRWRRSSELEMSVASPTVVSKNSPQTIPESPQDGHEKAQKAAEEEVTVRLKQFVHLKENQYLTERVSCKEAKKMTCDCVLTHEEIERGEFGCGEDCLNRLLMIEW